MLDKHSDPEPECTLPSRLLKSGVLIPQVAPPCHVSLFGKFLDHNGQFVSQKFFFFSSLVMSWVLHSPMGKMHLLTQAAAAFPFCW